MMWDTVHASLRAAEQKARYDAACKRLLSEKIILAWIMRSCLEEYKDLPAEEIAKYCIEGTPQVSEVPVLPEETNGSARIRGTAAEDVSMTEGSIYYDIRFLASAPKEDGLIQLIINLEAQNNFYPGYPLIKRALYYCSRMISSQYGTEFTKAAYGKLKKVYSIWICPSPPKERENTINRYRILEEHLVGAAKEAAVNYDLLSVVMLCLGDGSAEHPHDALHMLGTLLSNETSAKEKLHVLKTDFHIPMDEKMEGDVLQMCNLSEGVEKRGIRKGIQQGRDETLLQSIRAITAEFGISIDKAMSILNIAPEDQERYRALLLP